MYNRLTVNQSDIKDKPAVISTIVDGRNGKNFIQHSSAGINNGLSINDLKLIKEEIINQCVTNNDAMMVLKNEMSNSNISILKKLQSQSEELVNLKMSICNDIRNLSNSINSNDKLLAHCPRDEFVCPEVFTIIMYDDILQMIKNTVTPHVIALTFSSKKIKQIM